MSDFKAQMTSEKAKGKGQKEILIEMESRPEEYERSRHG
jgi:hypothetical protein